MYGYTKEQRLQARFKNLADNTMKLYAFAINYFIFMSVHEWRNYFAELHTWKVLGIMLGGGMIAYFIGVFLITAIDDWKSTGKNK